MAHHQTHKLVFSSELFTYLVISSPQYLASLHAGWWTSIPNFSHVQCLQGIHLAPGNYGNRNETRVLKQHSVYTVQLKQNGKTEDLENITSLLSFGPACHNSSGQNWLLLDVDSICWNFLNHQHWLWLFCLQSNPHSLFIFKSFF